MRTAREIQDDVLRELERDGRLIPAEIGVTVVRDVVTLTGTVHDQAQVDAAAEITLRVTGVRDVANELTVADGARDDATIAHALRQALRWNTAVPAEQITSIVSRGIVTLRGDAEHWYERTAAEHAAASVPGVVSVDDRIRLLTVPTDDAILLEEVEEALTRVPLCDGIAIRVASGVVTLAGTVATSAVRQRAGAVAAAASGVRSVVNQLKTSGRRTLHLA